MLLHGPLLGWAKMSGDTIFEYKQPSNAGGHLTYMMPRRTGVEFFFYPWHTHLRDGCTGARKMLQLFGEWTFTDSVANASCFFWFISFMIFTCSLFCFCDLHFFAHVVFTFLLVTHCKHQLPASDCQSIRQTCRAWLSATMIETCI